MRHEDEQKVVTLTEIGMTGRGKGAWEGHGALGHDESVDSEVDYRFWGR